MALRTRVWSAGKLLLLGGALLVHLRVVRRGGDAGGDQDARGRGASLSGKSVNEASVLLIDAGLILKVEEGRRVDPKVPAGQILAQDPRPGSARAASGA